MADRKRKKTHSTHRPSQKKFHSQGLYTPFEDLDQHLAKVSREISKASKHSAPVPVQPVTSMPPENEDEVFRKAMSDVVPLVREGPQRVAPAPPTKSMPRFLRQEELEVYSYLIDLVGGDRPFELTYSDEYVDGAVVGLSPKILKKLRNGDFSYQDYVDLHGFNRLEARDLVARFLRESFAQGYRCVLIVSGRGLNSEGKEPVLKRGLVKWLTHAPLKRIVLAFASARAHDGGAGAFYVLLRRNEGTSRLVSPAK